MLKKSWECSKSLYFWNILNVCEIQGLSKDFSFWTVSLDFFAMFKIQSLQYKDLILNSRGVEKVTNF